MVTAVAALLSERVRYSNVAARHGGDEFAILLPGASVDQAETLAERLRFRLESTRFSASRGHGEFWNCIVPDAWADAGRDFACCRFRHVHRGNIRMATACEPPACTLNRACGLWETHLVVAYLGVTMKRMFSTGPEVLKDGLDRVAKLPPPERSRGPVAARYGDRARVRDRREGSLHSGPLAIGFENCRPRRAAIGH